MATNERLVPLELQLAAVLAEASDRCGEMRPDELVAMARSLVPLIEDAANYYLDNGIAPEICDPQD